MTRRTFALSLAASTAFAAETRKERGQRLIEKVIEGLGGDTFRTLRNCTQTGRAYSFYRDELKGLSAATIYTRYLEPELLSSPAPSRSASDSAAPSRSTSGSGAPSRSALGSADSSRSASDGAAPSRSASGSAAPSRSTPGGTDSPRSAGDAAGFSGPAQADVTPSVSEGLLQLQRQVLGRQQESAVLFTRREAYEVTYRGARPLDDETIMRYRETTLHDIFYILRERLSEPGMEFESAGADVVENQSVETIDIYDAEDRSLRVWVNSNTFLPIKQRYTRWDPTINERREEVTYYAKYRNAGGGVMWPFDIQRERDTEKIFHMYSDTVTVNDPLSSSLFELPNGIRILKK